MKRDMDLIRELLLRLEAFPMERGAVVFISPDDEDIAVEGYNGDQIDYHLSLIREAGLVENVDANPIDGIAFRRLSWQGHDYLDSIRDPEVWAKTKKGALAAGGFTFELVKDLARGFLKKQIEERTGIPL